MVYVRALLRSNHPTRLRPWPWLAILAGLILAATALLATTASENHAAAAPTDQALPTCTDLRIDQDDDNTPGARVDLELTFEDANGNRDCTPGKATDEIVIELPEEVNVPDGFDEDDVTLRIGGARYDLNWADHDPADGGPHEIELPSCREWRYYRTTVNCDDVTLSHVRIVLNNLRLPNHPPPEPEDEPYIVSVQWDSGNPLTGRLDVYPALLIDDDDEPVRYGETVTFTGIGFTRNVTANVYANQGGNSTDCSATAVSDWREIASPVVGSDYRFTTDVLIDTSDFRSAGKYQLCVRDGAARKVARSVSMTVAAGLIVSGSGSVSPGEEVRVRLVGGNPGILAMYVGGRPAKWRISSDSLYVTLPPDKSGTVQIRAVFSDDTSASTTITIADAELDFNVVGNGVGLGQTLLVSARQLAGERVCRARLDGVDVALLGDSRRRDECVPVHNGRFNASILLADPNGDVSRELIDKMISLKDGDKLKLEIIDNLDVKASADVPIAAPRIILDTNRTVINRGESIVIRGENFPPETPDYYNAPQVRIEVNGRRVGSVYPSSDGRWRYEYDRTNSLEPGQRIRLDVYIDNYRLRQLTADLDLEVAPIGIAVTPSTVHIYTPITITVTGLDRYIGGYGIRIRNGPFFTFNGASTFQSDRDGSFSARTTFPDFEPLLLRQRRSHSLP